MSLDTIKNNVKACMFDQYGTVVDMQGGLVAFAAHPFAIAHHLIGNWLHGGKTAGA